MPLVDPISSLTSSLSDASLIPSIIPDTFSPSALIRIVWPSGAEVLIGNTIDATAMTEEPGIEVLPNNIPAFEASTTGDEGEGVETTYTLAMFDPDAPSRDDPKFGCFRHWVITGLKAPAAVTSQTAPQFALASQPAVTPYRAPAPGPGTGDHRYVFLLYEEPRAGVTVALDAPERGNEKEERRSWNPTQFAEQHKLRLVAANFFVCHVDI